MSKKYTILIVLFLFISILFLKAKPIIFANDNSNNNNHNFYSITIDSLMGAPLDLSNFKNKVILIVNVASKCGFTSQYEDLETLYQNFKDEDFVILGVPSNDFGGQEPGTAKEIETFCRLTYGVSFIMTEKVKVKGANQHELYHFLTQSNPNFDGRVSWNFTKFLVDKNGNLVDRFSPLTNPLSEKITHRIKELL